MSDITLILLSAGSSSRFEMDVKKQWLRINHSPLWQFVTSNFENTKLFSKIIITSNPKELVFMQNYTQHLVVAGADTRQGSLKNALLHVETEYVLVSDVARACVDASLIKSLVAKIGEADTIVPSLKVSDTVTYETKTIDRDKLLRIQTPQLSKTSSLKKALESDEEFTDESSAIVAMGGTRAFIEGDIRAEKITFIHDLQKLSCLSAPSSATLVGNGYDVHAFEENKTMYLCGVEIESDVGFKAHSDGDVAIHALIDALLGAAGMGDIGMLFPDNDDTYKGIDSKILLKECVNYIYNFGFIITNVDITIIAQTPRLAKYKQSMRQVMSEILHVEYSRVNIKATTTEGLGFVGKKEGVAVNASATLNYFDWTK